MADRGGSGRRAYAGAIDLAALLREARGRSRPRLSRRDLARGAGVSVSTVAQLESRSRTGVTLETLERLLAAAGFQLDVAPVPLGEDIDRAADELARAGLERRVRRLPFLLAAAIRDLGEAGVAYVVSGRTAALLQGVPVQLASLDLLTREHEDQLALVIRRMGALRWVDALPQAVTVRYSHQDDMAFAEALGLWEGPDPDPVTIEVPVLPLPLLELDDPRSARALARVLARLAFRA